MSRSNIQVTENVINLSNISDLKTNGDNAIILQTHLTCSFVQL